VAGDEVVRILVVCSANQCRSPMTAAFLARRAAESGRAVHVSSAGTSAGAGFPATSPTVDAARKLGVDVSTHRSTPLDASAVRDADLVIALERRHVQEVVLHDPSAFSKTYTLKELVRRGAEQGARIPDQSVHEWLAMLHEGRRPTDLLGMSNDDDVADPTGSNATDHRTTAETLDALAEEVLALLFGAPAGAEGR
jgi:protein-tyrosine-phosphatase